MSNSKSKNSEYESPLPSTSVRRSALIMSICYLGTRDGSSERDREIINGFSLSLCLFLRQNINKNINIY